MRKRVNGKKWFQEKILTSARVSSMNRQNLNAFAKRNSPFPLREESGG
jgi:hypothetical protein